MSLITRRRLMSWLAALTNSSNLSILSSQSSGPWASARQDHYEMNDMTVMLIVRTGVGSQCIARAHGLITADVLICKDRKMNSFLSLVRYNRSTNMLQDSPKSSVPLLPRERQCCTTHSTCDCQKLVLKAP